MNENLCRLCLQSSTYSCVNIFSEIGVDKKMIEILSEHFKCDITEEDSLPNAVCQECWATTEAFHELYTKSKEAQEKFLNSLVKTEWNPIDDVCSANDKENANFVQEKNIDVEVIKEERNSENSELDNEPMVSYAIDGSSNDKSLDANENDSNAESSDELVDTQNAPESKKKKQTRKRWGSKKANNEYQRLFDENKHLFDLSCDCCSKIFESLDEARAHYLSEHNTRKGYIKSITGKKLLCRAYVVQYLEWQANPEKFKCVECNRIFTTTFDLERHMKLHQRIGGLKSRSIPCDICHKLYASADSLQRHKKVHANNLTENKLHNQFIADNFDLSCDLCSNTFTTFYEARQHYKEVHNEEKGYLKCCRTKLRSAADIREHIKTHLHPETFTCDVCNKRFATQNLMVRHKRQHRLTMAKSYICDFCGKSCRDKKAITLHLFTKHVKSEPKFECEICQKKFQLQNLLKNHMYGVHREKNRCKTCEVCGKSFYTKFHLNKHMLAAHTDKSERLAMRKQCEHCGEWLLTKSGIYYHQQLHTTGIQKCSQCEMELPNRPALMAHIRQYHRAHQHKCSYCGKSFSTKFVLRTHEESHTRHKTYQCKYCPKVFTVRSSRQTHTRRNHQEELKLKNETKNLV